MLVLELFYSSVTSGVLYAHQKIFSEYAPVINIIPLQSTLILSSHIPRCHKYYLPFRFSHIKNGHAHLISLTRATCHKIRLNNIKKVLDLKNSSLLLFALFHNAVNDSDELSG
jgi:hypothetical protein